MDNIRACSTCKHIDKDYYSCKLNEPFLANAKECPSYSECPRPKDNSSDSSSKVEKHLKGELGEPMSLKELSSYLDVYHEFCQAYKEELERSKAS
jgi:hypothetical protein